MTISCQGSWFSPRTGYVRSTYGEDEIDAIAAYNPELDRCYLIPAALICGMRLFSLRLAPPRNNQRASLNWATDYELSGAVAQLEERRRGTAEAGGSSPPSSIPGSNPSPSVEVGAHMFRNHFGYYMEQASAGQEIKVTRRGKPYVRLLPAKGPA